MLLVACRYFVALLGSDNAARVKGGGHVRERERSQYWYARVTSLAVHLLSWNSVWLYM
jgi:hypothetical protein